MKHFAFKTLFITTVSLGMAGFIVDKSISEKGTISPLGVINSNQASLLANAAPGPGAGSSSSAHQTGVSAAAAYLMGSDDLLYSFRDQKQWPIASVTKLMTALVARKLISEEKIITMNQEAVAAPGEAGDFRAGERFRAKELVQAMLVASSNDAAKAIGHHYGEAEFVAEMNKLATLIGMRNTVFVDAAGLSAGNLSTPADLNKLVRFIWLKDPEIFAITRLTAVNIVDIDAGRSRKLNNINLFAGRSNFLGGKTGQIPDSEGNLVSIFSLPDKSSPIVIVVLGADDRFKETEKILTKL